MHLERRRTVVRQTVGAGLGVVAAALRKALWQTAALSEEVTGPGERRDLGPDAGALPCGTSEGSLRDPPGQPAAAADPRPGRRLGRKPARVYGSRQRGPLRQQSGGDFTWSLVYTCQGSTWTEGRAVWNKGAAGVVEQTRDVEQSLPFDLLGFDFDNGREWMNWTLIRYLQVRLKPVSVTRSRPDHKDDHAHVEQKNWMWPRQLLGYGRLEDPLVVPRINGLDKEAWGPLHNFFLPSMKLPSNWRQGSRWVRKHDRPQTACQRLMACDQISAKGKRQLRDRFRSLDPFLLARDVEQRLKGILK